ncbi:glycosyltransferase family 2 protein [bacterium]|nr:glycosyltransferase family 2 protein [bacterium]
MNRIVVIIPARNEAGRVGEVVRAAKAAQSPSAVWVVDNASADSTAEEALQAGAQVMYCPTVGKGNAVAYAMEQLVEADDVVVLLDGDLLGLTAEHIDALIAPITSGDYVQACAVLANGLFHRMLWRWHVGLTGTRAFRAGLLWEVCPIDYMGWSLEAALNSIARWSPLRPKRQIAKMYFAGVTGTDKRQKLATLSESKKAKRQVFSQVVRAYIRFVLPIRYKILLT